MPSTYEVLVWKEARLRRVQGKQVLGSWLQTSGKGGCRAVGPAMGCWLVGEMRHSWGGHGVERLGIWLWGKMAWGWYGELAGLAHEGGQWQGRSLLTLTLGELLAALTGHHGQLPTRHALRVVETGQVRAVRVLPAGTPA